MKYLAKVLVLIGIAGHLAIAAGQVPEGLEGTLVVLNKSGHDATFIDLASGETLATLPTGRGPHELIATADGRLAIGTDYAGGNSLTVFDVANLRVVRTIDLSEYSRPHGILMMPGEEEVIVTSEGSGNLVLVDFRSGEVTRVIPTGRHNSHMVALSADGSRALTSNGGTDSGSIYDVSSGRLIKDIEVPDRPEAVTTNRAGTELWIGSNDNGVVTVFDVDSGNEIAQWDGFEWPYRILLTRDERYAIMPDLGREVLRLFDVASKTEIGMMNLSGTRPQGVVLHPDDRTLFLSLAGSDEVLVVDIPDLEILGRYQTGSSPDGIAYSPLELR